MSGPQEPQVFWHATSVARQDREQQNRHRGCVLWFTGLSGSGKSTVANLVESILFSKGCRSFLLDGDNVRHGLCAGPGILEKKYDSEFAKRFGLGFSPQDREENIRRVGCLAQLFCSAGLITLTAFVSPYRKDRDAVRGWVTSQGSEQDFIEIFVNTPLELCEQRDPKGLYKQAREGKIPHFTGISDPYEAPVEAELVLDGSAPPENLAQQVVDYLYKNQFLYPER